MQHPDEGMIHTWLDGELPAEEAAALETHAATCEQCKAAIAEARGFIAASSRIIGTLDNVPSGVIPVAKPVNRVWYSSPQFRAAAAVLVVAGASLLVMRTGTQKPMLADSARPEASEAATAQRVMSASGPAEVGRSARVEPPVVADQAAAKEEDFSGKGVKGGTSTGVIGQAAVLDTNAVLRGRVAGVAMKSADAMSARRDFQQDGADLRIVRVDSTETTKKTTYQSLAGTEVVLTEEAPASALSKVAASNDERRQRGALSESAVITSAPAAPAPAAQRAAPIQTITWVDPVTRKRYSLSGRVSVTELEAIKARLLQTKQ